ncbi:MAG TPA: AAA family ATPase, partial [Longilinea sp.]|nr:AAA family ATPase [Longilinea sp.]
MNENNWKAKWSKEQIKALLLEQFQSFLECPTGIERERLADLKAYLSSPQVVIVTGLRRVGKSTLLAQFAHIVGEDIFYYLNFDDERFSGFASEDFNELFQVMIEIFGERKLMFLDEVQNVPGWERFVRRLADTGMKFYVTGSNASLLSQELGTRLTGRYIPVELYPFS